MRAGYSVHYHPTHIAALTHIVPADECRCDGMYALPVGGDIAENKRGRSHVTCNFTFCLACGRIMQVNSDLSSWFEGWQRVWREFGWQPTLGARLMTLFYATDDPRAVSYRRAERAHALRKIIDPRHGELRRFDRQHMRTRLPSSRGHWTARTLFKSAKGHRLPS